MKKLKSSNGFTLVELIVVIAMLAILASVSIGGFEYSQKRAAIENDKALVKQLNQVLDSYSIFTHNEGAIHDALIEEFGDTIEIQSLKFGYDIYCYKDLCEFYLLDRDVYENNDNYISISNFLNYKEEITKQLFVIKENYFKETSHNNKTTSSYIREINQNEYQLEVNICVDHNDDYSFTTYSHTVLLNDLLTINDEFKNTNLTYTLKSISEVKYENCYKNEMINKQSITFYYPGTYELSISDGTTNQVLNISVYNISFNCEMPKLSPSIMDISPTRITKTDNLYNVYLPVFSYLGIYDYSTMDHKYITYEWDNYDHNDRIKLIETGRLLLKINNEFYSIIEDNKKYLVYLSNLSVGQHIFEITYYYQGYNGNWCILTQTFTIKINQNGKIEISKYNSNE